VSTGKHPNNPEQVMKAQCRDLGLPCASCPFALGINYTSGFVEIGCAGDDGKLRWISARVARACIIPQALANPADKELRPLVSLRAGARGTD